MQNGETRDFVRDPWRVRAIMQKDVLDEEANRVEDMVFWFVASTEEDRDEWFAHAISSDVTTQTVDSVLDTIPPAVMNVMLPLAGQRWNLIAAMPTQHARSQRNLLTAINADEMLELMGMSRDQLLGVRTEGEGSRNPSMN